MRTEISPIVQEAEAILKTARRVPVKIPVGAAYSLFRALVAASYVDFHDRQKEDQIWNFVERVDSVLPEKLIMLGKEEYTGNLDEETEILLSRKELMDMERALFFSPIKTDILLNETVNSFGILEQAFLVSVGR